jgi:hypothetical protein
MSFLGSCLKQRIMEATNGEFEMKEMGKFLKWVNSDIKKESITELEVSQLSWKQVSRPVTDKARNWYMKKAREL